MSPSFMRRKFTTGVSLEPDVVQYLDDLTRQTSLNRSWLLNAIVREYVRLAPSRPLVPLSSSETVIEL